MNKEEFAAQINSMLKLIRTEYGLTQDKMAVILGISKKTLVESEKGRRSLGWTEVVALVSIFSQSQILNNAFGGDLYDIVSAIAFENVDVKYPSTMGGKVWWKTVYEKCDYKIQQNIISKHYRLLNKDNQRMISSFEYEEVLEYFQMLEKQKQ